MKNKISDLNDHLFAQLERLGDENLSDEQMKLETRRTRAIVAVSEQLVKSAGVSLKAAAIVADSERGRNAVAKLPLLEGRIEEGNAG